MADTRQIFYGDPFLSDERQKERVEGLTDSYLSNIMALPMEVLALMAPDAGYTPGELRSSPQDRLRGEMLAWELHQQGRSESPDYAKGADLGTDLSYVADPFFDIPGVAAARLGKAAVAAKDIPKRGKQLRNKLADEAGLFTLYQGEPSALKGQFSALHDRVPRLEIDDSAAAFKNLPTAEPWESFYRRAEREKFGRRPPAPSQMSSKEFRDYERWRSQVEGEYNTLNRKSRPLKDILDHPELYERQPGVADMPVEYMPHLNMGGYYDNTHDVIAMGDFGNEEGAKGLLLHEIQHALQERGGMARGGSPGQMAVEFSQALNKMDFDTTVSALAREAMETFDGNIDKAAKELNEIGIEIGPEHIDALMQRGFDKALRMGDESQESLKKLRGSSAHSSDPGQDLYRRLAGEIEARDAAARRNLTAEERRRTQPYSSEDIPLSDYIVRGDSGMMASMDLGEPVKTRLVDPSSLVFRETEQNKLDYVRENFGDEYPPTVSVQTGGGIEIIDGHNRAAVAMERGDQLPTVTIPESAYKKLQEMGYDDMEIAHAALEYADEWDAASAIDNQFAGAGISRRARGALDILMDLLD